jgi:hypothetical protein
MENNEGRKTKSEQYLLRTVVQRRYRVFASEGRKRTAVGKRMAVEGEEIRHAAQRPHVHLRRE